MSKKKSLAWGRKTTGHTSKGVLNYGNVEKMGRSPGKITRKTWRRRNHESDRLRALDAERQAQEAHINWGLVRAYLDLGMTLEQAKQESL